MLAARETLARRVVCFARVGAHLEAYAHSSTPAAAMLIKATRKSGQGQVRSPFKRIHAHVFLAHIKRTAASDGRADSAVTTLRSAKPNSAAILQSLPRRKVSLESACMSHGPNLGCRIIAGIWCRFSRTDFPPSWTCDRAKLVSNR